MNIEFRGPLGDKKGLSSAPGLAELLRELFVIANLPEHMSVSITRTDKGTSNLQGIGNVTVKGAVANGVEIRVQPGDNTTSRRVVVHRPAGWTLTQLDQALRTAVRTAAAAAKHGHENPMHEAADLNEIVARLQSSMLKAKRPGDWKAAFALLKDAATEVALVEDLGKYRHEVRLSGLAELLDKHELYNFKNALISVKLLKQVKPGKAGNGEHPIRIDMELYAQLVPLVAQMNEVLSMKPPCPLADAEANPAQESNPVVLPPPAPATKKRSSGTNTFTKEGEGREQLSRLHARFGFGPFSTNQAMAVLEISHEITSRLLYNARRVGILFMHPSTTKNRAINTFNAEHSVVQDFIRDQGPTQHPAPQAPTDDITAVRSAVERLREDELRALAEHEAARLAANEAQRALDEATERHAQCTERLRDIRTLLAQAEASLEVLERSRAQAVVDEVKQFAAARGIPLEALLAVLSEQVTPAK